MAFGFSNLYGNIFCNAYYRRAYGIVTIERTRQDCQQIGEGTFYFLIIYKNKEIHIR